MGKVVHIASESWDVLCQMSPYLLFGFLMAGVLSVFISPDWVEKNLGGRGIAPVVRAALFGVPLPLCSCSVLPVSASIRRHGATRAATVAFLLSTPQTGVDSILATHALLGPVFALFRVGAAFLTGVIGGGLVMVSGGPTDIENSTDQKEASCTESCCDDNAEGTKVTRALRYGLVNLPRDIGRALLLGIFVAGALSALVPTDSLAAYIGGGILSIVIMMAVGIPVYVCATASVPIAAGFIHMGASPGAAFAFLVAGPATNAAALAAVWKILEKRAAAIYLASVAASAVGFGLLLDVVTPFVASALPILSEHHHPETSPGGTIAAVVLLALFAHAALTGRTGREPAHSHANDEPDTATASTAIELMVTGMTCGHCAQTVTNTLQAIPGVRKVAVDLPGKRVVIHGTPPDPQSLAQAIRELGFKAKLVT